MDVYMITMFRDIWHLEGFDGNAFESGSFVGFFSKFSEADEVVRSNTGDISECIYAYAVIERVGEGLYVSAKERWVYEIVLDGEGRASYMFRN